MSEQVNKVTADELRSFVERIENLEEEKKSYADDIRDVYTELKGKGYDPKAIRRIIQLRKMEKSELQEQQAILDVYLGALGMTTAN